MTRSSEFVTFAILMNALNCYQLKMNKLFASLALLLATNVLADGPIVAVNTCDNGTAHARKIAAVSASGFGSEVYVLDRAQGTMSGYALSFQSDGDALLVRVESTPVPAAVQRDWDKAYAFIAHTQDMNRLEIPASLASDGANLSVGDRYKIAKFMSEQVNALAPTLAHHSMAAAAFGPGLDRTVTAALADGTKIDYQMAVGSGLLTGSPRVQFEPAPTRSMIKSG